MTRSPRSRLYPPRAASSAALLGHGARSGHVRSTQLALGKLLVLLTTAVPHVLAVPLSSYRGNVMLDILAHTSKKDDPDAPDVTPGSPEFWMKLGLIVVLVLLGGIFAGLTLGLMGLDMVNLQVMSTSGSEQERDQATKVLKLLNRGRHWVLVVLLLSNVVVNESLPIFLDSVLGGGVGAVVASTALVVIFGEIIPQSICVRYGLSIGARCCPFVLMLMYVEFPIAYPIAKLLDYLLGEDHGTTYRKAELKTFVGLHRHLGSDNLDEDEVTIISSVLELSEKTVEEIMTPIDDVFSLAADQILDETTVKEILDAGYSRVPVHETGHKGNFLGMLLIKKLITYDPEDAFPASAFQLSALPETGTDMSCLEALNFFQQGRSHILLVSSTPGENGGAMGVVSLEDVIEEMIGEEIIDETDVFVDVHNKIKVIRKGPQGSARGKGLTPLLRGVIERRKAGRPNAEESSTTSPRRNIVPESRPQTPMAVSDNPSLTLSPSNAAYGTISKADKDAPENGPTARAFQKVKLKGGEPAPRKVDVLKDRVRNGAVESSTTSRRTSFTSDIREEEEPAQSPVAPGSKVAGTENEPLLRKQ
ncbi:hypothetical protein E5Q_01554 [Mixia osmundae IAM 14324]|uniref:CNNM transmembrane domain-containing protein n=1 Tax=Mixia osmundae (strain CBS 9802 / IAM 14324 / JCM 22182 / KY 12970) TaxID=764103 RepID=G7DWD9_MIXOS|nr:hypothetical protein E5Q_01554 [Mixia osmundae IAM 14324]